METKKLELLNTQIANEVGVLISKYSWGEEYPVDPIKEHKLAEYAIGAYESESLIGISIVNRFSSPDGKDNGELWFADAVVVPEFRNQGVFTKLYEETMHYMLGQSGRILTCTDNPIMESFLSKHGWQKIRDTLDEEGGPCLVFEYFK